MTTASTTPIDRSVALDPDHVGRRSAPPTTNGVGGSVEGTPER